MKIDRFTPKQIAGWTAFGRRYIRDMVYADACEEWPETIDAARHARVT